MVMPKDNLPEIEELSRQSSSNREKSLSAKSRNGAIILATGAAFGKHYDTKELLDALMKQRKDDPSFDMDFAQRVFEKCGYKKHSVALKDPDDLFRRFSRTEYLNHRVTNLIDLAEKAGNMALDRWGGPRSTITHLLWGTMTGGMHSPSLDVKLVGHLGLSSDVARTNLEGMGCLTGYRLLNIAREISEGNPDARILVLSGDLRSALGNSMSTNATRKDIVSVALFRDAASAAVVGGGGTLKKYEHPRYEIITGLSRVVDDDHVAVDYFEDDDGAIRLHLSKDLPDLIAKADKDFIQTLLSKGRSKTASTTQSHEGQVPHEINGEYFDLLCHTGGPRVLREVAKSLGLERRDLQWSWEVMENHGNLSGASNLAVLDNHNCSSHPEDTITNASFKAKSKWAICLSMGPGPCLEGLLLKCLSKPLQVIVSIPPAVTSIQSTTSRHIPSNHCSSRSEKVTTSLQALKRTSIHIVGGGIAGMTLAAGLDPSLFDVKIFESSPTVQEKGYGMAIWSSTLKILGDKLGIDFVDYFAADVMSVRLKDDEMFSIPLVQKKLPTSGEKRKGFIQRSKLLNLLQKKVLERHPEAIHHCYRCQRLRFNQDGTVSVSYEVYDAESSNSTIRTETSDVLIGADGVNSTVRKYVAMQSDCRMYGHMTAYRFLIPRPTQSTLKLTRNNWNMSIGELIHSPCYHISEEDSALSVVVLEYDGTSPSHPRKASVTEILDVAERSKLNFVIDLLKNEKIEDCMCYSTYHIDCKPWHNASAAIIGDAAHAYGPLTAKMANLAINDAHSLSAMLNEGALKDKKIQALLQEWEDLQRPKFSTTKLRTLRHLQLYSPSARRLVSFLWKYFPRTMLSYFGSIFAYDYEVFEESSSKAKCVEAKVPGIVGISHKDPMQALLMRFAKTVINSVLMFLLMAYVLIQFSS